MIAMYSRADFREAVLKETGAAWWEQPCALRDWLANGVAREGARAFALELTNSAELRAAPRPYKPS